MPIVFNQFCHLLQVAQTFRRCNPWIILATPIFYTVETILVLALVSHPLTGSNYNTWSCATWMTLNAKNKRGFIDGSIPQPAIDNLNANTWSRCNSMVISWLLNVVSKEIVNSLIYLHTAQAVWAYLNDHFRQSNAPRIF